MLHPVAEAGSHTSACWLPAAAAGLSAEAEELREQVVLAERGKEAAEVAAAALAGLGVSELVDDDAQVAGTGTTADNEGSVA